MTSSAPTPAPIKDRNTQAKSKIAQEAEQRRQADQREWMRQQQLRVREVQALEAIAESLHVAFEEKILTWRQQQETKAIAEQKRIEAEMAQAKADAELLKSTEAPQAA